MSAPVRILVVEDDEAIAAGLSVNLRLEGYLAEIVHDGLQAQTYLAENTPDLVLLDINLPRMDGFEILSEMRKRSAHPPVVVLSAREGEYDKVAALRLGADDYVTKPFALAELMARVAAVLRRSGPVAAPPEPRQTRFSDVLVDLDAREVSKAGQSVRLTHLEFELLTYFLDNPARVFSREQLLRDVWGVRHSGSRRTVDNFVAQLRSKLEDDPESPCHFLTVRGAGYRFETTGA